MELYTYRQCITRSIDTILTCILLTHNGEIILTHIELFMNIPCDMCHVYAHIGNVRQLILFRILLGEILIDLSSATK
jgi:hypothetical protein